jgi:ferredoxin--NADP+ reductase
MNQTVMRLAEYDIETQYSARVVQTRRMTPFGSPNEVKELLLELDAPGFAYEAGQSIGVLAPGAPEFGAEHHLRLYSIIDPPTTSEGPPQVRICVRRCEYVDEYSGEKYPGVASNYLCDRAPGDVITVVGPFGIPFRIPPEDDATLILIGAGTGIAPFRAFVKHLYRERPEWKGRVWLFHGARTGLELLYQNHEQDDFAQYYDRETFQAFHALSARPGWSDAIAWDYAIARRSDEIWEMLGKPHTYVYVAGLEKMREELDKAFRAVAGSEDEWNRRKAELRAGGRWVELLY